MQDQYAGDIGDYGKFGLLRALECNDLSVGINWYYVLSSKTGNHANDGKFKIAKEYFVCDPELASELYHISNLNEGSRSVEKLERAKLLKTSLYYREPVADANGRRKWQQNAVDRLNAAEVVFLDPDNGLITNSIKRSSKKCVKYVLDEEIEASSGSVGRNESLIWQQGRDI